MKRLRAVVQNNLLDFAATMCDQGHTFNIVDVHLGEKSDNSETLTREEYIDKVNISMRETRGRELPGPTILLLWKCLSRSSPLSGGE